MDIQGTLLIDNEPYEVGRAAEWLDATIGEADYPPRLLAVMQVALEEVLTNIMLHGYADIDDHKIELTLEADTEAVTLRFVDDGIPFDPTERPLPEPMETDNDEAGGLGILFVRRLMDEVAHERAGGQNHLTLRKFVAAH